MRRFSSSLPVRRTASRKIVVKNPPCPTPATSAHTSHHPGASSIPSGMAAQHATSARTSTASSRCDRGRPVPVAGPDRRRDAARNAGTRIGPTIPETWNADAPSPAACVLIPSISSSAEGSHAVIAYQLIACAAKAAASSQATGLRSVRANPPRAGRVAAPGGGGAPCTAASGSRRSQPSSATPPISTPHEAIASCHPRRTASVAVRAVASVEPRFITEL
ncbi:MAG: hypothetical protein BGO96_02740 [Micrococcales bacterium 73-15]|nr:MAG: hypothetical protein BGO96_02740 [Micrococcales bacterium 73-15]